ncbi:MAG: sigma-54 factor interaction domain-containing protein, partial [Thiobacillus sp.]|nr:sigma-54 factor interaction domain-containing protein [Thiobacillus sp.]
MLEWDSPVLILGETGSGKGVLARWIHLHGPRREEAFVNLWPRGLVSGGLDLGIGGEGVAAGVVHQLGPGGRPGARPPAGPVRHDRVPAPQPLPAL